MARYCRDKLGLSYVEDCLQILLGNERQMSDEDGGSLIAAICAPVFQLVVTLCLKASRRREELEYDLLKSRFLEKYFVRTQDLVAGLKQHIDVEVCLIIPDHQPVLTWGWKTSQTEITGLCTMMIEDARAGLPEGWVMRLWSEVETQSSLPFAELYQSAITNPISSQLARLYEQGRLQRARYVNTGKKDFGLSKAAQYAAEGQILKDVFRGALLQHEENCPEVKDKMYRILGPTLPILHSFTRR